MDDGDQQRVLITADTVGGVFSYAASLAAELSRRGFQVALATMGAPATADQREQLAAVPGLSLFESSFALEWADDPWRDVDAAGEWLLELEREFRPDVVHLNGYSHAALPWSVPALVVAHSCVLSWWRAVLGEDAPSRFDTYRARVRAGLEAASLVVAPTAAMLSALRREHAFSGRACVIANGADPARFRALPKRPFFLAAGRLWDRAKNLALLERAAPALPWPVQVAGAAEPGRAAASNLLALGRLAHAELAALMAEAPVFLHPARYEPFGLAPLEAALSGAALVLGDIESLREVWGDAAVYVDPDDVGALAREATRLAQDGARRERLAARAQRRAASYGLAATAAMYAARYRELAARRARSSARSSFVPSSSALERAAR